MSSLVSWIKVSGIPLSFPLPSHSKNKKQTIKPPAAASDGSDRNTPFVGWIESQALCMWVFFFPHCKIKKKKRPTATGLITNIPSGYLMASAFSIKHRLVLMPTENCLSQVRMQPRQVVPISWWVFISHLSFRLLCTDQCFSSPPPSKQLLLNPWNQKRIKIKYILLLVIWTVNYS